MGSNRRKREDEFLDHGRETLRDRETPLTEEEVQQAMRETIKIPQASLERGHKKFVEKVFAYLHPDPVRRIMGRTTFGLWLESARKEGLLTCRGIARALGKEVSAIESLETGAVSPLSLTSSDAADIVILFRIHIKGVAKLLSNSEAIRGRGDKIKIPSSSEEAALAKDKGDPSGDPSAWLGALFEELQRRKATHLLA
jgi:hypothetical protein